MRCWLPQRYYSVLGFANTSTPIEAVEAYELPRIFRENNVDERYRIAWVEQSPEAIDTISFVESILTNRDLPGRQFSTVDQAAAWLLGDREG